MRGPTAYFARLTGRPLLALLAVAILLHPASLLASEGEPDTATEALASAAGRPNIVWIFTEDMNDWMGCYGDSTVPTPHIDQIAQRGTRFTRAYMPAGVCSATRSALALGAMQTSLGVHNHRSSRRRVPGEEIHLPAGVKTFYELLRENGYFVTTQGINKNDFNFIWEARDLYDIDASRQPLDKPVWRGRPAGTPFFAQIQLRGGKNSGRWQGEVDPAEVDVPPYYPDVPVIRREIAHHYDTIKQTDNEVGRVIDALERDNLLQNTVVFFFTDHGMRLYRHKQWLYEGGIRVPVVVAGPGIPQGKVRDDLISGIDLTVTTLALAGIEPSEWMEGRNLFAHDYQPREYVVSARDRCDYTIDRVRAITTERYKYLRNFLTDRPFMQPQYRDGRKYMEVPRQLHKEGKLNAVQAFPWREQRVPEELYDLKNDPHEIRNLADDPAHAEVLARHRALLTSWIDKTGDQGQQPESADSLRGVLKRWSKQAVNPEYERAREKESSRAAHSKKEVTLLDIDRHVTFLIKPEQPAKIDDRKPWVWYAPTLHGHHPGKHERWMFERLAAKGIAVAGVDVGESYGNPDGRKVFQAFYEDMISRGFSRRPVLLARSRGGLMLYNWAVEHPDCVAAVAGIYPVTNLASYPGLRKAAPAYKMTPEQLRGKLSEHNPVDRIETLADARVPIMHIHGDADDVVPYDENSGLLAKRYRKLGGPAEMLLVQGRGHDLWEGWFRSEKLVNFMLEHALAEPVDSSTSPGKPSPANDAPPELEPGTQVTIEGTLRGGMMAIGGETTGWVLQYGAGDRNSRIEVDMRKIRNPQAYDGTRVTVTGKVDVKNYVERGRVKILRASRVRRSQ